MGGCCMASKVRQPATSPTGPKGCPKLPKLPKLGPGSSETGSTIRVHGQNPLVPRSPPAMGLRASELAGPKVGPRWAQTAQNHQKRGPASPRRALVGSTVRVHGQNPPWQRLGCLFVVIDGFLASNSVRWPNFCPFGP